jgi:hypothetical protein
MEEFDCALLRRLAAEDVRERQVDGTQRRRCGRSVPRGHSACYMWAWQLVWRGACPSRAGAVVGKARARAAPRRLAMDPAAALHRWRAGERRCMRERERRRALDDGRQGSSTTPGDGRRSSLQEHGSTAHARI